MLVNHNYQSGFNKWNGIGKILKYYMLTHNLQFKDENDVFVSKARCHYNKQRLAS